MLPADRIQIRIHDVVCRLHLTAFFLLLFRCHSAIALTAQSGSTPDVGFYVGLQLAAFADLSTAWDRGADFTRNMIGGAGFGIRLIIPILDMIRLDFAFEAIRAGNPLTLRVAGKSRLRAPAGPLMYAFPLPADSLLAFRSSPSDYFLKDQLRPVVKP